jgi:phage-related protein
MILIRQISYLKPALKDFQDFPAAVQQDAAQALSIAARGGNADTANPFKGVGSGVFEIALKHRGDAFRVLHAFQKKSKSGIKTPQVEIDLIHERLKRLKDALK